MLLRSPFFLAVSCLFVLVACGDEVVSAVSSTCEGPQWRWENDLDTSRWVDVGAAAAESGGVVLVAWDERLENSGDDRTLNAALLDATTGETLRTISIPGSEFSGMSVLPIDSGFYVVTDVFMSLEVYFVDHEAQRFVHVGSVEDVNSSGFAVTTDAGVLVLGSDGVQLFDHDGAAAAVHDDGLQRGCAGATALPDGRVMAWCYDWSTEDESLVTMNADGSEPALLLARNDEDRGWVSLLAAGDAGTFYLDAGEDQLSLALLNDDGTELVAAVPLQLQALEASDEASILGAGACSSTCDGISIVAEGNTAVIEVATFWPDQVERFLVNTDGNSLTIESIGTHHSTTRPMLTPAQPGALSASTRERWHVPVLDVWPPQTLVVERICVRRLADNADSE